MMQGELDRADEEATRYHASILGSRDFVDIAVAELLIADVALARGRPLAAMRWAREALSQEKIASVGDIPARIGCVLAIAGAQLGDSAAQHDGLDAIGDLRGRFPRSEPHALIAEAW